MILVKSFVCCNYQIMWLLHKIAYHIDILLFCMKEMVGFVSFTSIDLYTGTFHLDINLIIFCTLIYSTKFL